MNDLRVIDGFMHDKKAIKDIGLNKTVLEVFSQETADFEGEEAAHELDQALALWLKRQK